MIGTKHSELNYRISQYWVEKKKHVYKVSTKRDEMGLGRGAFCIGNR